MRPAWGRRRRLDGDLDRLASLDGIDFPYVLKKPEMIAATISRGGGAVLSPR